MAPLEHMWPVRPNGKKSLIVNCLYQELVVQDEGAPKVNSNVAERNIISLSKLQYHDSREFVKTPDGNYVTVSTYPLKITKLNSQGKTIFHKTHNLSNERFFQEINSVSSLSNGNILIIGGSKPKGDIWWDYHVIMIDKEGDVIWEEIYGNKTVGVDDNLISSALLPDGGFLIVGFQKKQGQGYSDDQYFVRVGGDGNVLWEKKFDSNALDRVGRVFADSEGLIVFCNKDTVLKLDKNGNEKSRKLLRPIDKVLPVANGWLLIEHDYEYQTNEGEINISRINNRSEIVWTQKHEVSPIGFDGDIAKTKDGGFVFIAPSGRVRTPFVNMFKFNSSGAIMWKMCSETLLVAIMILAHQLVFWVFLNRSHRRLVKKRLFKVFVEFFLTTIILLPYWVRDQLSGLKRFTS